MSKRLRLERHLANTLNVTRKQAAQMLRKGAVTVDGTVVTHKTAQVDPAVSVVTAYNLPVLWRSRWVVMLNKPAGVVCALRDAREPTVMPLIDDALMRKGLAPVGRLDKDTTGILLLTDDGALSHRLTHPRRHVAKVYRVEWAGQLDDAVARFAKGITLKDSTVCRPATLELTGEFQGLLTLHEGKYHQVKRMIAACGGRVTRLHRQSIGGLTLPADLYGGEARLLEDSEIDALLAE